MEKHVWYVRNGENRESSKVVLFSQNVRHFGSCKNYASAMEGVFFNDNAILATTGYDNLGVLFVARSVGDFLDKNHFWATKKAYIAYKIKGNQKFILSKEEIYQDILKIKRRHEEMLKKGIFGSNEYQRDLFPTEWRNIFGENTIYKELYDGSTLGKDLWARNIFNFVEGGQDLVSLINTYNKDIKERTDELYEEWLKMNGIFNDFSLNDPETIKEREYKSIPDQSLTDKLKGLLSGDTPTYRDYKQGITEEYTDIKSKLLKSNWKKSELYKSMSNGVILGVKTYNNFTVVFKNSTAFVFFYDYFNPLTKNKILREVKFACKTGDVYFPENIIEHAVLCDGVEIDETLINSIGLNAYAEDIKSRCLDIKAYTDFCLLGRY